MSDTTGRTGFRLTHTKAVGERRAIVHEMMRELDPKAVEYWARENTNIVVEDEALDRGFVNDGTGRFVRATSMQEVIDYGQSRVDRLSSPLREDKPDKKGKMRGGTVTTSMFVAHLPKSLCKEVPDFYGKGRSRWIARDRDEAMEYFTDVLRFLGKNVIPGGFEAILGFDIQHSETTPHVQVLADTFADDPKHEGQLRPEWSRAYAAHRDVKGEDGKMLTGRKKLERYQDDLKAYMVARGWPVEREVDPLRHDKTETKAIYGALRDERRQLDEQHDQLKADREDLIRDGEDLEREKYQVRLARKEVETERETAREEGRREGYEQGLSEGRAQAEALREQARQQLAHARVLVDEAAKQDEPLPLAQTRETFRVATGMLADRLIDKGIRSDVVRNVKEWADRSTKGDNFAEFMERVKRSHDQQVKRRQRLRQNIATSVEQLNYADRSRDDYGL